ncbi:MAG: bile acid:sodium symporter family protein [Bacteroidales bacterium]|nr:bile acid:sodium symporter family protein [Bacteroidales bacterium]
MFADSLEHLDNIRLNFNEGSLLLLNLTLAFVMFGVALELKKERFKRVFAEPKSAIIGVSAQFILLPLLTLILVLVINPSPSIAFGMILVAACPGGNISNFMTSLAKGNTELSVSLTAVADLSALIMTPLNFAFWGSIYAAFYSKGSDLLIPIEIDPFEMFKTMIILLGIPLTFGMLFSYKFPKITSKIVKPIKIASIVIFASYVLAALSLNWGHFVKYVHLIFLIVLIHNALALTTGFSFAKIFKLSQNNIRTITIETGIQNSGLALVLIFNPKLFNGLGGMAFIAALWGIWHIISGLGIAAFWSRKPLKESKNN